MASIVFISVTMESSHFSHCMPRRTKATKCPFTHCANLVTLYVAKGRSCQAATQQNGGHMLPKHIKKRTKHTQGHIRQTSLLHTAHPACDKLEVATNCFQSTAACPSKVLVWRTRAGEEGHWSRKCSRMISEILTRRSPTPAGGSNTTRASLAQTVL